MNLEKNFTYEYNDSLLVLNKKLQLSRNEDVKLIEKIHLNQDKNSNNTNDEKILTDENEKKKYEN